MIFHINKVKSLYLKQRLIKDKEVLKDLIKIKGIKQRYIAEKFGLSGVCIVILKKN
jgi:hypothetical protein